MSIVIIGSGLAGQLVIQQLREKGFEGRIVMISEQAASFYLKPSLSNLNKQSKQAKELIQMDASSIAEKYQVKVLEHCKVERIDRERKVVVHTQGEADYEYIVMAVGAVPNEMKILPKSPHIFRVNDLEGYEVFAEQLNKEKELVILGGGLIGCEFANDLASRVKKLTVIETMPALLNALSPQEMGQILGKKLEGIGVDVRSGIKVKHIDALEHGIEITLDDDKISADVLLVCTGLRPNTELAKEAGLSIKRGVVVNQNCQTSDESIYALGDCAEVCGISRYYVAPIRICAEVVAGQLMGKASEVKYPPMPVMVKTPAYPICLCFKQVPAEWQVEQQGDDVKALAYDKGKLVAFALSGAFTKERIALKEQMPDWL